MKVIDVYEQYFEAECVWNTVPRHAAAVKLTATSDEGMISYEVSISFFPHNDAEDFGISYDACFSEVLCNEKGRRSKKKDSLYLSLVNETADVLANSAGGRIFWDKPLIPARYA